MSADQRDQSVGKRMKPECVPLIVVVFAPNDRARDRADSNYPRYEELSTAHYLGHRQSPFNFPRQIFYSTFCICVTLNRLSLELTQLGNP